MEIAKEVIEIFKNWIKLKIKIHVSVKEAYINEGEIWWASLGQNIGEEIFGKGEKFRRPVLIFRKFTTNSFLAIPLTEKEKKGTWYVEVRLHEQKRWGILNQIRTLDKKRLDIG